MAVGSVTASVSNKSQKNCSFLLFELFCVEGAELFGMAADICKYALAFLYASGAFAV